MDIRPFLDSTYLKTAVQAGISDQENERIVKDFINEAIAENFKLVMIRPEFVGIAKRMVSDAKSTLAIGTVIDFPEGRSGLQSKLDEANKAIADGADELDFVVDYAAFKEGKADVVRNEVAECAKLCIAHLKIAKFIIETAALDNLQIAQLSSLIKNVVMSNFDEGHYSSVFVKSSTGFYQTADGEPNGATIPAIIIMLENASPLPVKASGGVRTYEDAVAMINIGVKRIGTSSAKAIVDKQISSNTY